MPGEAEPLPARRRPPFRPWSQHVKENGEELEQAADNAEHVEKNYAPFDAIMQKGYKGEYKALKKQLRKKLCNGEADLEQAATDYVLWFYSQFDRHIQH